MANMRNEMLAGAAITSRRALFRNASEEILR